MRLPFFAAGPAQPTASTQRPRIVAGQSQASSATFRAGVPRILAQQSQATTGRARPKILARQSQMATARGRTRIDARQSQQATVNVAVALWPNSYRNQHEIRLRAWPGATSTAVTFLLPFNELLDAFKTTANGGEVQHASGYDILFQTTGGVKLGHVDVAWDGTTGRVVKLVSIPNRDLSAPLSIYCYTGKAGLVASEQDAALANDGGWLAWFKGGSGTDLTAQSHDLTANGTPGTTTLLGWPAYNFDGVDDYLSQVSSSYLNGLASVSCVSLGQTSSLNDLRELFNVSAGSAGELGLRYKDTATSLIAIAKFGASSFTYESALGSQSTDPQAVAFVAAAGAPMRMAINGALDVPNSGSGTLAGTLSVSDTLEWGNGRPSTGSLGWLGPGAFLALRSGAMPVAEMEAMTAALVDPRRLYGIGAGNVVTSSNRSPVAQPVFAAIPAGVATQINVAGSGFDQNSDTLSVTDASVASGLGTVSIPNTTDLTLTGNTGVAQAITVDFGLRDPSNARSRGRLYATATIQIGRPKFAPTTGTVRNVTNTNASGAGSLAAAYAAASALGGDQIILAAGSYAGFNFNRDFPPNNPTIIRSAVLSPWTAIFTNTVTLSGTGHWPYEIKTQQPNTTGGQLGISLAEDNQIITRCWINNADGIKTPSDNVDAPGWRPRANIWIGWNRFTGQNTVASTRDQIYFRLPGEGNWTTNTAGPNHVYIYSNFFWGDLSTYSEDHSIYFGETKRRGNELPMAFEVYVENNFWHANCKRLRTLYLKCACNILYNQSNAARNNFGIRHGMAAKFWGNRSNNSGCHFSGVRNTPDYPSGGPWPTAVDGHHHDIRGNIITGGNGIRLWTGCHHFDPQNPTDETPYYQAAHYALLVGNRVPKIDVGFKEQTITDQSEGGLIEGVSIYKAGEIVTVRRLNVATPDLITESNGNGGFAYPGDGTMRVPASYASDGFDQGVETHTQASAT